MCKIPTTTVADIKATLALYKTSALVNPNTPDRAYDIAYYCDIVTAAIVAMETSVPPWPSSEIKTQLLGRLNELLPLGASSG
jgi:hypothetical protein